MDLLLWRHAEAEDGPVDLQRQLTKRGEKQAQEMAQWIRKHQPKKMRILVSPAVRCQQTAKALGFPFETVRSLGPEAGVSDLIAASGWPSASEAVLIVGHQPTLGHMASLALAGQESDWSIKKGALWWLNRRERAGESQTVLRASITPELV